MKRGFSSTPTSTEGATESIFAQADYFASN